MALVPPARLKGKKVLSLVVILGERTMATQSTEGQFTAGLREMAKTLGVIFSPILSCQSFPQSLAAVISGRFAAFVPELAVRDLPADSVRRINGDELRVLDREAMLTWNPRFLRIKPNAAINLRASGRRWRSGEVTKIRRDTERGRPKSPPVFNRFALSIYCPFLPRSCLSVNVHVRVFQSRLKLLQDND